MACSCASSARNTSTQWRSATTSAASPRGNAASCGSVSGGGRCSIPHAAPDGGATPPPSSAPPPSSPSCCCSPCTGPTAAPTPSPTSSPGAERVPILDYRPRLVEANRQYRVEPPARDLSQVTRWWAPGTVLDQGQEGSCVGHGIVGEFLASPVRGPLHPPSGFSRAEVGHLLALQVYNRAKEIDEWEGVDYEGTSVRAGMLVGRSRGWYDGFTWAFNMTELRAALEQGPVVVGVDWHQDSYDALPNGDLLISGPVVGGHCLLVNGYTPNYYGRGARYRLVN